MSQPRPSMRLQIKYWGLVFNSTTSGFLNTKEKRNFLNSIFILCINISRVLKKQSVGTNNEIGPYFSCPCLHLFLFPPRGIFILASIASHFLFMTANAIITGIFSVPSFSFSTFSHFRTCRLLRHKQSMRRMPRVGILQCVTQKFFADVL